MPSGLENVFQAAREQMGISKTVSRQQSQEGLALQTQVLFTLGSLRHNDDGKGREGSLGTLGASRALESKSY